MVPVSVMLISDKGQKTVGSKTFFKGLEFRGKCINSRMGRGATCKGPTSTGRESPFQSPNLGNSDNKVLDRPL